MKCQNCGNEINDGAKFCSKCGTQQIAQPQKTSKKNKNKKSKVIVITAIILCVAIIAGCVTGYIWWSSKKKDDDKSLEKKLKSLTDKEVVEMYYEDFNNDNTKEMFAIVGKGDEDDFSEADIWFISDKSDECVKKNISGHFNDILEEDGNKYISVEVQEEDGSSSFIYGVEEKDKCFEPDISGKYSDVHMEDGKVVVDSGDELDVKEGKIKFDLLEATEEELKQLAEMNPYFIASYYDYLLCDSQYAMQNVVFALVGGLYFDYFGFDNSADVQRGEKLNTPDPLNRFTHSYSDYVYYAYIKVPADKADWVLKNILNLEPDRTINTGNFYYKDGFYYLSWGDAGDACYEYKYISGDKLNDGRYKVILQPYFNNSYSYPKTELVVGLKDVDGKRTWSYYNVSCENKIPSDAMTFNGNRYYIYSEKEEGIYWTNDCGGHHVSITSKEEQKAVLDYVKKTVGDCDIYLSAGYGQRINGNSSKLENNIYWSTGEKLSYTNWGKNQPAGEDYYSVFMSTGKKTVNGSEIEPGQWYVDNSSSNSKRYYVIEWEKDY